MAVWIFFSAAPTPKNSSEFKIHFRNVAQDTSVYNSVVFPLWTWNRSSYQLQQEWRKPILTDFMFLKFHVKKSGKNLPRFLVPLLRFFKKKNWNTKLHLVNSTKKEKSWESKEIEFSSHRHFFVTKIKMTWSEHTIVGLCTYMANLFTLTFSSPLWNSSASQHSAKNRECYGTKTSQTTTSFAYCHFSLMKWRGVNGMGWWKLYRNNHRYIYDSDGANPNSLICTKTFDFENMMSLLYM